VSEIEQRLRAAMEAAFADQQPRDDLAELVRMRHRRHRARAAVAAAAAVAVIALAAAGLRAGVLTGSPSAADAGGGARSAPVAPASAPALLPPSVSRNVSDTCAEAIWSQLPAGWQRQSVQAGPLWLVGLRQVSTSPVKVGSARVGGLFVMVRNGVNAWVTVVGPADSYFRFLFGPNDLARGADGPYSISDGESGVTFEGCPSRTQGSLIPGYTQYGGYFLVTVPRGCVTLDVWAQTGVRPTRVVFPVGGAQCRSWIRTAS
jgi:hypothetical protein